MNANTRRARMVRIATATLGLGVALTISACGAGQISQTATQAAAVNGNSANLGSLAIRNVHILAPESATDNKVGGTARLALVIANSSTTSDDKLIQVSSSMGTPSISGSTTIPASDSLVVGTPAGQLENPGTLAPASITFTNLSSAIPPGLTVDITLTFEKAGDITISVPVDMSHTGEHKSTDTGQSEHQESGHSNSGH
ncbi:MAG: hypothetical protein ACRCSF_11425 [Mycobacteriaceae bacterium]